MPIVDNRNKILFLPVVRGNYPVALTQTVKAVARKAATALEIDAIFPDDDAYTKGVIQSDDDIRAYYDSWKTSLYDIKALVVFSGDFMRERVVQDTVRLLPEDVPVFLMVDNDRPDEMVKGKMGDSLCGTFSVHHTVQMIGRELTGSCRIDARDEQTVTTFLDRYKRISDAIETMRNMRIALVGVNPTEFTTTFTNQLKLFELGFSIVPYELCTLWADTMVAKLTDADSYSGDIGTVKFWKPIRQDDPRVEAAKAELAKLAKGPDDPEKLDKIARCYAWIQQLFESEHIDTGAIHCWSEFQRFYDMAPCTFAMMANLLLQKPLVCEGDICHAIMTKLAWPMTGEAGVILDINNNGWDSRVFNVFHCSQTPPTWMREEAKVGGWGSLEGRIAAIPFTGVSAKTTGDAFKATVFHGQFLSEDPGQRGSSGWAYVPNLPDVVKTMERDGIHHFVAMRGHCGADLATALAFRGIQVSDQSIDVEPLDEIPKVLPKLKPGPCKVFP